MSFTPTIERRFRLHFRFYDLNKDGKLDIKDLEKFIETYVRRHKTDSASKVQEEWDNWWSLFQKFGLGRAVTEEQYISVVRFMFVKDFVQFRKSVFKFYEAIFSLIDHDKDNKISPDEMIDYYACFNVTDADQVKKIFKKLDLDKDGFVTRDEWILSRLDYATRDDPDHEFGFIFDFSSPVPEKRSSGRITPILLKRYKRCFRFFDTNKDGVHTLDDYFLVCDNFCDQYHSGEEERAVLRKGIHAWWKELEPKAINGKITEEHYVYLMTTKLVTDFDQARLEVIQLCRPWFHLADHDGDGWLSEDELVKMYTACGKTDISKVKKIFKQVDLDDDGFISEEEWILANLDYWTIDDSSYDYGFLYDVE